MLKLFCQTRLLNVTFCGRSLALILAKLRGHRTFKSGARLGLVRPLVSSEGIKAVLVSSKSVLTRTLILKVWKWPLPESWFLLPCDLSSHSPRDAIHDEAKMPFMTESPVDWIPSCGKYPASSILLKSQNGHMYIYFKNNLSLISWIYSILFHNEPFSLRIYYISWATIVLITVFFLFLVIIVMCLAVLPSCIWL